MDKMFNSEAARELAELLYKKLKESKDGILSFNEIIKIYDSKPEYGFSRVNGGAIRIVREKKDVVQLRDEDGRPYLKLIH